MNTGQMMITLAAMILLSVIILRVTNGFLNTGTILNEAKFGVLGVSLATSVIEEALGKAFDENTADSGTAYTLSDLSSIGKDGETYPAFDDFDDFHNLTITVDSIPSATFNIHCKVGYINPLTPDSYSGAKTWHKKISVQVTTPYSQDTVEMSTIYSYFYYR